MKVIILQTGEVKNVADGYARNYLIPKGLAQIATPEKIVEAEKIQAQRQKEHKEQEATWKRLSETLSQVTVTVFAEANAEGTLFGAVSYEEILTAVHKRQGMAIQTEWLRLSEPIKKVGKHAVAVEFPNKLKTTFTLEVQRK